MDRHQEFEFSYGSILIFYPFFKFIKYSLDNESYNCNRYSNQWRVSSSSSLFCRITLDASSFSKPNNITRTANSKRTENTNLNYFSLSSLSPFYKFVYYFFYCFISGYFPFSSYFLKFSSLFLGSSVIGVGTFCISTIGFFSITIVGFAGTISGTVFSIVTAGIYLGFCSTTVGECWGADGLTKKSSGIFGLVFYFFL